MLIYFFKPESVVSIINTLRKVLEYKFFCEGIGEDILKKSSAIFPEYSDREIYKFFKPLLTNLQRVIGDFLYTIIRSKRCLIIRFY